jgi:acyl-CoA synthetase (AMP-forming)/AMP-acid ligase II/acyl carrier protein
MTDPIMSHADQIAALRRQRDLLQAHAEPGLTIAEAVVRLAGPFEQGKALELEETYTYGALRDALAAGTAPGLPAWDGSPARRQRILRLLQLADLRPGQRVSVGNADVAGLALGMALCAAACFVADPGTADLLVLASLADWPAQVASGARVLVFGPPCAPAALPAQVREGAARLIFVDSLPSLEIDLCARSYGSGAAPTLVSTMLHSCTLAATDGRPTAPGAPGRLVLEDGTPTGRWGRLLLDGSLQLLDFAATEVAQGERTLGLADLEAALSALPGLRELGVLAKPDVAGRWRVVVYFALRSNVDRVALERRMEGAAAAAGLRASLLALPRLPRDACGAIDPVRLAGLPVLDAAFCESSAAAVRAQPGVGSARALAVARAVPQAAVPAAPGRRTEASLPLAAQEAQPARRSELEGPPLPEEGRAAHLAALLERAAAGGGWIVFVDGTGTRRIGYADLVAQARAGAAELASAGVQAGQAVLLHLDDPQALLTWFWACQYAGAAAVLVGVSGDSAADAGLLDRLCARLGTTHVIRGPAPALAQTLSAAPGGASDPAPGAIALILLTSGSTGEPKLVAHTHARLIAHGYVSGVAFGLAAPDAVALNWMPLDHVGALVMAHLRDVQLGASQVQVRRDLVLADPWRWFELVERYRVTQSWAPNFAFALLGSAVVPRRADLSSMRFLINGGEAVAPDVAAHFLALAGQHGLDASAMKPAWGMSETSSLATVELDGLLGLPGVPGAVSVGRPIAGVAVRVVDADGAVVPEGQVGQLEVRGATVFDGYLGAPAAGEWFATGDAALVVGGRLSIVGREKDVVVVNGRKIAAEEIERELHDLPGLDPAAVVVIARPLPGLGTEQPVVVFVPAGGVQDAGARICKRVRQRFQIDAVAVPVAPHQIPRTSIGKPQRQRLKQALLAGQFDAQLAENGPQAQAESLPPWFFRPRWHPSAAQAARPAPSRWLVLADGDDAARALEAAGQEVRWQRWTSDAAGAVTRPGEAVLLVPGAGGEADLSLLALARAAAQASSLECYVLADPAASTPAAGALYGVLASLALERPHWTLRWVERDAADGWHARVGSVLDEARAIGSHLRVRHGSAGREAAVLVPESFLAECAPALRSRGCYVVVGALGALGRHVCRWLMQEHGAAVIGVGRRSAEPAPCDGHYDALAELSGWPRFTYVSADVADQAALESALAPALARHGPLDGAFHLAGEFMLAPFEDLDPQAHRGAISSKLAGSLHLQAVLARLGREGARLPLVLFGSVNGWFGAAGAASYAAATAAQQFLAEAGSPGGVDTYCLGWSQWQGMGLTATNAAAGLAQRQGFLSLSVGQGMASLERALGAAPGVLFIGLDADNEHVLAAGTGLLRDPLLRIEFGAREALTPVLSTADDFGTSFESQAIWEPLASDGNAQARYREIEQRIVAIWREILGGVTPDVTRNFFEQGGNSLRLLQVKVRMEEAFACSLEVTDLFRLSTIQQLALHLAGQAAAPAADDAGARGDERRRARGAMRNRA